MGTSDINIRALYDIIANITGRTVRMPLVPNKDQSEAKSKNDESQVEDIINGGPENGKTPVEHDGPKFRPMSNWDKTQMMLLEGIFITAIAGLHAVAWNHNFPSFVEMWFWRASCLGMLLPMPVIGFAWLFSYHTTFSSILGHSHMDQYNLKLRWAVTIWTSFYTMADIQIPNSVKGRRRTVRLAGHMCMLVIILLLLAGYLVAILFITVESYISLRNPSPEIFLTPTWSDYWPHF